MVLIDSFKTFRTSSSVVFSQVDLLKLLRCFFQISGVSSCFENPLRSLGSSPIASFNVVSGDSLRGRMLPFIFLYRSSRIPSRMTRSLA